MAVSRRTVLRGASIGLVGASVAVTASCEVPAALASIAGLLPDDKGDRVGEAMYGAASKVVDRTNLRAAIATNFTRSCRSTSAS